jgi:hypothetical protein
MPRGMTRVSSATHHRLRVGGGSLCARSPGNALHPHQPPVTAPPNSIARACSSPSLPRAASSDADAETRPTPRFPQMPIAASRPQARPRGFLP